MNAREKILAAVVGASLLALLGSWGLRRMMDAVAQRQQAIANLQRDLDEKQVQRHRAELARQDLTVYEQRSLPSDPVLASSRYRAWLHDWADHAGLAQENVKEVSGRRNADHYNKFTFSMTCDGDLRQLVRLLHAFYSYDYLHRIKHLSVRPLKDKTLTMAFTIETLSLPTAGADKELGPLPASRLAFGSVDEYLEVILNRNPYSPANQPPRFVSERSTRGYVNQRITIRPRVEDPEKNGVRYRLGPTDLPGIRIDARSGTIEWTPEETGNYEIPVSAVDEGFPPKETSTTIRVEVTDPPPPREPEPGPPPFDAAKFAYVSAMVEVNGRPQVWISSRTDGQVLKLHEGETFQIGLFEGTVTHIGMYQVEIRKGDTLIAIRYGRSLTEGQVISTAATSDRGELRRELSGS